MASHAYAPEVAVLREAAGTLFRLARQFQVRVFGPDEWMFWAALAGSVIALEIVYRVLNRPRSGSFWSYPLSWRINTHKSSILDYKFLMVQKLVIVFIMVPVLVSAATFGLTLGNRGSKILAMWLGPGPGWTPGVAGVIVFVALSLLFFDIGHTISHYIKHKVPFFWEFHKIHHAAEVLTPATSFRGHPIEILLDGLIQGPLQAPGLALFYYLYGGQQFVVTFVGVNAVILFYHVIDNLRHTHAWISFGPKLEHIFASPAQHQIHHSRAPQHLDTNFAQHFAFLDWIAGTLYVLKEKETLDFGLSEGPDPELGTVWGLYWVPIKRAFRGLAGRNIPLPAETYGLRENR